MYKRPSAAVIAISLSVGLAIVVAIAIAIAFFRRQRRDCAQNIYNSHAGIGRVSVFVSGNGVGRGYSETVSRGDQLKTHNM
eukprot:5406716-Pleurochrysis_carterae.AAC.1